MVYPWANRITMLREWKRKMGNSFYFLPSLEAEDIAPQKKRVYNAKLCKRMACLCNICICLLIYSGRLLASLEIFNTWPWAFGWAQSKQELKQINSRGPFPAWITPWFCNTYLKYFILDVLKGKVGFWPTLPQAFLLEGNRYQRSTYSNYRREGLRSKTHNQ